MRRIDHTGKVFGMLTVVRMLNERQGNRVIWECRCECGKTHNVAAGLLSRVKSCGCYNITAIIARNTSHGLCGTNEYKIWKDMRRRCNDSKHANFKNYGAKGIRVCDRWNGENGAANFVADMGLRPSKGHSVDRRDNKGDYSPENCYWATHRQQSLNTSRNRRATLDGETKSVTEWAEVTGITKGAIRHRLVVAGWDTEAALTIPAVRHQRLLTHQGRTQTLTAWSREIGLTASSLGYRLSHGWSLDLALTTPGKHSDRYLETPTDRIS